MTLENIPLDEQVRLLSGDSFWTTPGIPEAGVAPMVLSDGPHGIRFQAREHDHLGLHASEPATCFPVAAAVACSWDPEVARAVGEQVGHEARALGVTIALGPGVNIKRSPLCGRNFEYYSEDPLLSGVLGTAHVEGLQSTGVGASVKHFAANNQETERMRIDAQVDERTLREIYLPAFERVVREARPATVMCSYNRLNGTYASQNRWLLTEVLREQWGFEGAVVSDWGACSDRVAALAAGLDLEMPGTGGASTAAVLDAVAAGTLSPRDVTRSAERVAELARRARPAGGDLDVDTGHRHAAALARECIVLLRNQDRTLPLREGQRVAVLGDLARELRFQGGGSSHVHATRVDSPLEALRELAPGCGIDVTEARGYALGGTERAAELREEAVALAAGADVAVVVAGLGEAEESEGFDREQLSLPAAQIALIQEVAAVAPRTVVVLTHGGLVTLEPWHDQVDAILDGWLLGQAGGTALAETLLGFANPSGRLAETIPLRLEDTPCFLSFPGEKGRAPYAEGVMVGYRGYATRDTAVRYAFGHGLSYTEFTQTGLEVEATGPDTARAAVTVANVGDRAGATVVQLYVAPPAGEVRRPVRELRAFTKVRLEPGEQRRVQLDLDPRAFAYWDVDLHDFHVAPGDYAVQLGEDALEVVQERTISLEGHLLVRPLSRESTVGEWFTHPVVGPVLREGMAAGMTPEQRAQAEADPDQLKMVESMSFGQFVAFTQLPLEAAQIDQLIGLSQTASS